MQTEIDAANAVRRDEPATSNGVSIMEVHDIAALRAIEELQGRVWGEGPRDIVPSHILWLVGKSGGIVLGAFAGDELVGFVMGLLAQQDGRLFHASHILGVDAKCQGAGIGSALKWRQRDLALAQGLDLMTWTFDPLQSRNAYFNLHKLGARSHTYIENAYGDMDDDLNRGLPSDRLLVEWDLLDPPRQHLDPSGAVTVLHNDNGQPKLQLDDEVLGGSLAIAVPTDPGRLKESSIETALAWRFALRTALTWAFDRGYQAVDFRDGAYLLVPKSAGTLA